MYEVQLTACLLGIAQCAIYSFHFAAIGLVAMKSNALRLPACK